MTGGAGPSQTQQIDEFLSVGRGQPVGPLATSTGGRGIAADLLATRPLQVLFALRPADTVTTPFQSGLDGASLS